MTALFGTDGIRGLAGRPPLTKEIVYSLGLTAAQVLQQKNPGVTCRVLGVRDTRQSSAWIFDELSQGFRDCGILVFDAGVLSTPSAAYLVHAHRCQAAFVISASHNAPEFNGIKFFTHLGRKWPDEWEHHVEQLMSNQQSISKGVPLHQRAPRVDASVLVHDVKDFLVSTLAPSMRFSSFTVGLDCAHGANSFLAPLLLQQLGARTQVIANQPNGKNINVHCGSQHPDQLSALVRAKKCHVGFAFDGDGDRVVAVDEKGSVVDGDFILAILAQHLKKNKILKNNIVVSTVMANVGLKKALHKIGVQLLETPVGDRHVSEAMRLHGAVLGGEQSGHIILGKFLPSGDGLLTALHLLGVMAETGRSLSQLSRVMTKFPQVLKNIRVPEKTPLTKMPLVQKTIHEAEKKLGDNGRVLVRYSGTEPLLRVMLEGPSEPELQTLSDEVVKQVHQFFKH